MTRALAAALAAALLTFGAAAQQSPGTPPIHARQPRRLVLRNAMVIYGNAKPPYGPVDITVDRGLITAVGAAGDMASSALRMDADTVTIDASGKYVMPGI